MDKVERIPHVHQWFATAAMEFGQSRCLTCGMRSQEFDEQEAKIAKFERELAEQNEPCTDAKEQGHGCYRAVKAENELAAQKEQYRVLTDEMLVLGDERNAAVLDAKENMEIANEFKKLMEQYRQHAEAAYIESARLVKMLALADEQIKENVKVLRVAAGLLSTTPQFSNMHPNDVLEGILKETREMK